MNTLKDLLDLLNRIQYDSILFTFITITKAKYLNSINKKNLFYFNLNKILNLKDIQTFVDLDRKNYSFAMTGYSFGVLRRYFPQVFEKVLLNGIIYARMSPDQKAQLVEHLISIGYGVGMCGDGANDCSALKAGN